MTLAGRVFGAVALLGAGALAIAAIAVAPHVLKAARPFVREGLKRGMKLYEGARASVAELAEDLEDLAAEAKADLTAKPRTDSVSSD